jgi:hypothetical protein
MEAGFDAVLPKPVLSEQVYACLSDLLGVRYEYADVETEEISPDWSGIRLPEELFARLKASAEISDVSALESCLDELEQLGPEGHALARELHRWSREYAIDHILEILREIEPRE